MTKRKEDQYMINLTNLNEGLFKKVAYYWNEDMPMMTMEECGELIKALSKYEKFVKRSHPDMKQDEIEEKYEKLRDDLMGEIRDVYIALEAIKILYGIDDNVLNELIEKKLNKKY